jgi:hypothetical protein
MIQSWQETVHANHITDFGRGRASQVAEKALGFSRVPKDVVRHRYLKPGAHQREGNSMAKAFARSVSNRLPRGLEQGSVPDSWTHHTGNEILARGSSGYDDDKVNIRLLLFVTYFIGFVFVSLIRMRYAIYIQFLMDVASASNAHLSEPKRLRYVMCDNLKQISPREGAPPMNTPQIFR